MKKYVHHLYESDGQDCTDDDNDENESFSLSGHFGGTGHEMFDEN
jgi:hypothetical protein